MAASSIGGKSLQGVNPVIVTALNALSRAGYQVNVTSGYRSYAQQVPLYQRYVNSGFNPAFIAAKPGQSNHQTGTAVDLYVNGKPVDQSPGALQILGRYGIVNDVKGDHPHVDLRPTGDTAIQPSSSTFGGWQTSVLKGLGVPTTPANIAWLNGWQHREGGSASFNPLNTTLNEPGATSYNKVGVRNFPNAATGVRATVATLRSYPAIIKAMKTGQPQRYASNPAVQQEFLKWSGNGYSSITPGAPVATPLGGSHGVTGAPPRAIQNAPNTDALVALLLSRQFQPPPVDALGSIQNPAVHLETQTPPDMTDALTLARQFLDASKGAFTNPGFAQYVHGLAGTNLPSSTIGQSAFGRHTSSPQAGDVSFFGTPPTHQGVHLDSGHILHSTDGGAVLRVSQLAHPAYLPGLTATRTY